MVDHASDEGRSVNTSAAVLIDGTATSWIAVQLRQDHDAGEGLAATGFLVFTAALVLGRSFGDRMTVHFSRCGVVRAGGLAAAGGTILAASGPNVGTTLAGWAIVGLAIAPLVPTILGAAPGVDRSVPAPVAIASVTTVGYLGSFTGPPLVGGFAEVTGLSMALVLPGVAAVATVLLAGRVTGGPSRAAPARGRCTPP